MPWLETYMFHQGIRYGWILMDFPTETVIRRIIGTNRSASAIGKTAYLAVDVDWSGALEGFFFADGATLYRRSSAHSDETVPEAEYSLAEYETVLVVTNPGTPYEYTKQRLTHCVFADMPLEDEYGNLWYYYVELNGNVAEHRTSSRNEYCSSLGTGPYNVYSYITETFSVSVDSYGDINATLVDNITGEVLDYIPFLWNDETSTKPDSAENGSESRMIRFDLFIGMNEYAVRKAELNGEPYDRTDAVLETDLSTDKANELILYVDSAHNVNNRSGAYCTVSEIRAIPGNTVHAILNPELIPEGKVFSHWNVFPKDVEFEGEVVDIDFGREPVGIKFAMPDGDVTVEAFLVNIGAPVPHSVTVTGGTADISNATEETVITLTADDTYAFEKWTVVSGDPMLEDEYSTATSFEMPYADVEIRAEYKTYRNIRIKGGMMTCHDATRKISGSDIEGAEILLDAYINHQSVVFDRWEVTSGNAVIKDPYDPNTGFIMPDGDVEITGLYVMPSERLRSVNVENGETDIADGGQFAIDAQVTLTAEKAPEGETFKKWDIVNGTVLLEDENSPVTTFTMPNGDVKVVAVYGELYGITVDDGISDVSEATEGSTVTITAVNVPEGKAFIGWQSFSGYLNISDPSSPSTSFTMPNRNVTISALFGDYHSITVEGGTAGANRAYMGNEIMLTADAAPEGMEFDRWVVVAGKFATACKFDEETSFFMPDCDVEIKATYKNAVVLTDNYQITVLGGSSDRATAKAGEKVTLSLGEIQDGNVFDKWEIIPANIELSNPNSATAEFMMPDSEVIVRALLTDAPAHADRTVSFEMNGHGEQVPAQTVNDGEKAEKPDVPTEKGYIFIGWYTDSALKTAFDFGNGIGADTVLYAKWVKNPISFPLVLLWILLLAALGMVLIVIAVRSGKKKKTE